MITVNGVSATKTNGEERFETFRSRVTKKTMVQYDYRHTDGELFSCIAKSLDECRDRRNAWLIGKLADQFNN